LLLCLLCSRGGLLPVGGLGSLGGSPGLLLRGSVGGSLPRSSAGFLLILAAGLLLRLPGFPAGLLLILPAGLSLYRRRVQAELPPVIPAPGTADILHSCLPCSLGGLLSVGGLGSLGGSPGLLLRGSVGGLLPRSSAGFLAAGLLL
jgi:hypothetical protein